MIQASRLFDLTGRVALITGGSRGLGQEMAEGLAEAGAALMLLARREPWLTPAVERLRGLGFRCEGTICNVADAAAYSAAKGGLIALTRELASKWARRGIRVNAIAPGFFPSRMTERLLKELQPDLERRIPMGRIGRAGELKGVAVFLASEASAYMTGQTLIVDGGATAV